MGDRILSNRELADMLDSIAPMLPNLAGSADKVREAAQRLRCGDQGEPTAIADQHDVRDVYSSHVALCERFDQLSTRLDTLERSQANTIRDTTDHADRLRRADGYIDGLAERMCSLEDRNEHVARILGADGPESGV